MVLRSTKAFLVLLFTWLTTLSSDVVPEIPKVESVWKAIAENGIMIVISGIFIVAAITVFYYILKQHRKQTEDQKKLSDKLLEFLMDNKEVHSPEKEDLNTRINFEARFVLDSLIKETSANDCFIMMYRNGGRDMTGRPFQNMSCLDEVVREFFPFMSKYQLIPRHSFFKVASDLAVSGYSNIDDVCDLCGIDEGTLHIFSDAGLRSVYCQAINDLESQSTVGFVGMAFKEKLSEKKRESVIKSLRNKTHQIEGVFINWHNKLKQK